MTTAQIRGEFARGLGCLECWRADTGQDSSIQRALMLSQAEGGHPTYAIDVVGEILDEDNQPRLIMGVLRATDRRGGFERATVLTATRLRENGWHERHGYGVFVSRGGVVWRVERVDVRSNRKLGVDTVLVWLRHLTPQGDHPAYGRVKC